ncbi:hypothetical protein ScPMuIL_008459 [Solemya velum]
MTDRKAVIKNADMAEEMQQDSVDCATQALENLLFVNPNTATKFWLQHNTGNPTLKQLVVEISASELTK